MIRGAWLIGALVLLGAATATDAQRIRVGKDGLPEITKGRFGFDYIPTDVGAMGENGRTRLTRRKVS